MQAIVTRYIGPSNTRQTRIKATAAAGSKTSTYKFNLNLDENHEAAATAYANSLGWLDGHKLEGGTMANGDYVFVLVREVAK